MLFRLKNISKTNPLQSTPPTPGLDGRIGTNFMTTLAKFAGLYVDPWIRALQGGEFASADRLQLVTMFKYLEFCLEQVGAAYFWLGGVVHGGCGVHGACGVHGGCGCAALGTALVCWTRGKPEMQTPHLAMLDSAHPTTLECSNTHLPLRPPPRW